MQTVNYRLLTILAVSVAALAVGVHLLHGVQVRRNSNVFKVVAEESGKKLRALKTSRGDDAFRETYGRAITNYGSYLGFQPDDVETREALGKLAEDFGDYDRAINVYKEVLARAPQRNDLRFKIADLLYRTGQAVKVMQEDPQERMRTTARLFNDARDRLVELAKLTPNDAQALNLLGRCQFELGNYRDAAEALQNAIAADPKHIDSYALLASLQKERLNEADKADATIAALIEKNPESPKALAVAGAFKYAGRDYAATLDFAERALKLDPRDRQSLLLATGATTVMGINATRKQDKNAAAGFFERGRQFARRGIDAYPKDVDFYVNAAELETRCEQTDRALAVIREGLKANEGNPSLLLTLGNLLTNTDQFDAADEESLQPLRKKSNAQLAGRIALLDGRIQLGRSQWRKAIDSFQLAREHLLQSPDLLKQLDLWMGRCYGKLGNYDQEVLAYRRALQSDPSYDAAQAALVDALINQGQVDAAMEVYQGLSARMGDRNSWLGAARLLMLRNLRVTPAERNWSEFEHALSQAEKTNADPSQILALRIEALAAQGRYDEVDQRLRDSLKRAPDQANVWLMLIANADHDASPEKADEAILNARAQLGDRSSLRVAEARHLFHRQGKEAAAKVARLAEGTDAFSPLERAQLWTALATLAAQNDSDDLAAGLAQRVAAADPSNLPIRLLRFESLVRAKAEQAEIDAALEEIRKVEGEGPGWHFGKALLLHRDATSPQDPKLAEALDHLRIVRDQRPNWPRAAVLIGSIRDRQGDTDEALINYQNAVAQGDRSPTVIRRLAQLLYERRRYNEFESVLQLLEEGAGGQVARMQSDLALRQNDYRRALDIARNAAKASSDFRDQLWLGQVANGAANRARTAGQAAEEKKLHAEAEAAYRKAVELAPENVQAWVALLRFLKANDLAQTIPAVLEDAAKRLPAKNRTLDMAQCYEAIDQVAEAEAQYTKALADAPNDINAVKSAAEFYWRAGRRDQAEALARQVLDGKVKGEPRDVNWARRLIVVLKAATGGLENMTEALKLIEANLASKDVSPLDRRFQVGLLLAMPSRVDHRKAMRVFEEMVAANESVAVEDQYTLAQLYLNYGNWGRFTQQMQTLIAENPSDPRFMATYIEGLLNRNELESAETYLMRLEEIAPAAYSTISLRAESLFRRGRPLDALKTLSDFIEMPKATPSDRATRLRIVAERMQQLAERLDPETQKRELDQFVDAAESTYTAILHLQPNQQGSMVAFLAKLGRISRALNLLETTWPSYDPVTMANAAAEIYRSKQATKEDRERCERVVQQAIRKFNRPDQLLIVLADAYCMFDRSADAERLYREVIASSENPVAKNNLAVLLALEKRNLDEALKLINQAIEKAGRVPAMLDTRASVYMALNEPQKAFDDLEEAIADQADPVRLFHQAQAIEMLGKAPQAAETMRRALDAGLNRELLPSAERKSFDALEESVRKSKAQS